MTDNRRSGIALIAGSIGGIITMAVHPVGPVSPAQVNHLALISGLDHTLALLSTLLLVLGACGLTRSMTDPDRLAFTALVVYFFAAVAIMIAASVSGYIGPAVMRLTVRDTAAAGPMWRIAMESIFQFNQAFAKIYSIGTSISITLWSASALRNRQAVGGVSRGMAIYGCVVAALLTVALAVGHLQLDVHGMAVVVVAQAVWFIGVGRQLSELPFVNSHLANSH